MYLHTRHTLSALRMLAADSGGGSGGSGKSLETQLADATAENKRLVSQVEALTKERDDAKAEVTKLTGQFESATKAATDAKAEVTKLTTDLSAATKDRDDKATKLTTAEANITRLESLCKIKGVDKNATVPSVEETGATAHVFDQWATAKTSAERQELYRKHKADISAEARRRGTPAE